MKDDDEQVHYSETYIKNLLEKSAFSSKKSLSLK